MFENGIETRHDIISIPINDNVILDYLYYCIKIFLRNNYKKREWGKGYILDIILNSIKIPKFVPNIDMDKKEIDRVMKEFYERSSIGTKNLSEIEDKYFQIQEEVDRDVYKCYGLSGEEIKVIEKFIKDQAYRVSRTT
jgi:hypothetical protein